MTDQLEYRIYYRALSSLASVTHAVGTATTCLVSDLSLSINVPYSLVATAVTPSGVESDYSNEIQIIRK